MWRAVEDGRVVDLVNERFSDGPEFAKSDGLGAVWVAGALTRYTIGGDPSGCVDLIVCVP